MGFFPGAFVATGCVREASVKSGACPEGCFPPALAAFDHSNSSLFGGHQDARWEN